MNTLEPRLLAQLCLCLCCSLPLATQSRDRALLVPPETVLRWAHQLDQAAPLQQFRLLQKLIKSGTSVGPALRILMPFLDDPLCRDQVVHCLWNAGSVATPLLGDLPKKNDPRLQAQLRSIQEGNPERYRLAAARQDEPIAHDEPDPFLRRMRMLVSLHRAEQSAARRELSLPHHSPSVEQLAAAMKHRSEVVRLGAINATRFIQGSRAALIPLLLQQLQGKKLIREATVDALTQSRWELEPYLHQLASELADSSPELRIGILTVLATMRSKGRPLLPHCLRMLDSSRTDVVLSALGAIRGLRVVSSQVTAALVHASRHKDATVRRSALLSLDRLRVPTSSIANELMPLLEDENSSVRRWAARLLLRTRDDKLRCIERLSQRPNQQRSPLLTELLCVSRTGTIPRPLLEEAMRICPPASKARILALWSPLGVPKKEARRILEPALRDPETCLIAVSKLAEIDPTWASIENLRRTTDLEGLAREQTVEALLKIRPHGIAVAVERLAAISPHQSARRWSWKLDPEAIPVLLDIAKTGDLTARMIATRALGVVGRGTTLTPAMTSESEPGYEERCRAVFDRMQEAIPTLVTFLDSKESRLHEASAESLRLIGAAAHPLLGRRLYHSQRQQRLRAMLLIGTFNPFQRPQPGMTPLLPQNSAAILTAALQDPLPLYQELALNWLTIVAAVSPSDPSAIAPAITQVLRIAIDKESRVQALAIATLSKAGPDAVAAALARCDCTETATIREQLVTLGLLRPEPGSVLPFLWGRLRSVYSERGQPYWVYDMACSLGPEAVPFIEYGLTRGWIHLDGVARLGKAAAPLIHLMAAVPSRDDRKFARLVELCLPAMNDEQREGSIRMLAQRVQHKPTAHPHVARLLSSVDPNQRLDVQALLDIVSDATRTAEHSRALESLGQLGSLAQGATVALIGVAEGDGPQKWKAIETLGRISSDTSDANTDKTLDALVKAFGRAVTERQRRAIHTAFVNIGRQAIPQVGKTVFAAKNNNLRASALATLHVLAAKHANHLVAHLESLRDDLGKHRLPLLMTMASGLAAKPRPPDLVERAIALLELEPDHLITGLSHLGLPAVPHLLRFLDDDSSEDPRKVVLALGRSGPAAVQAIPRLLDLVEGDQISRRAVARTLIRMGVKGAIALEQMNMTAPEWKRAMHGIWQFPNPHDLHLRTRGYLRAMAVAAMQHGTDAFREQHLAAIFARHTTSKDRQTQRWAQIGAAVGNPIARAEQAMKGLSDSDPDLRRAAARQIHNHASPNLSSDWLPTLVLALEDPLLCADVAGALGKLGLRAIRAEPALRDHLQDADVSVRTAVETALQAIQTARHPGAHK